MSDTWPPVDPQCPATVIYSASHLVAELFIGCVDPISSPKMEMYDQKNKS
jgi:hypothetical protein